MRMVRTMRDFTGRAVWLAIFALALIVAAGTWNDSQRPELGPAVSCERLAGGVVSCVGFDQVP